MQEQDIKRGHYKNIDGSGLEDLAKEIFGVCGKDGNTLVIEFGALQPFKVWVKDKSTLCIETIMQSDVDEATAIDTRKRYNTFMERATGFTAKQRSKRLQKKAKEGSM